MVCLKAKKKQSENQSGGESEIKLLEIISNCNWEVDRANMLSKISHIISKDCSKSHVVLWNNYALQFLPKADKPAVIPPELQSKLPSAMYSIRVRVTQNLNDIEQAENGTSKDGDASSLGESLGDEKVNSLSDKERQQYASLRIQKKLIDKIRFAEKLKDLIEQEERKGSASSKFSISKEGIEKALKRYKTQLWRAYTGNSNMTLTQLKDAVMKAKSSNYTEKITQAISAIEKKAHEATLPGSSQSGVTFITPASNFNTTSIAETQSSVITAVTGTSVVRSGSDLKTLSSTARARIEANQGIVIKGNSIVSQTSKNPVTRLLLVPITSEGTVTTAGLTGQTNVASARGASNVVTLHSCSGSSTTFKIANPGAELDALKVPSTSTSAPVVGSPAPARATVPFTGPSVVTMLGTPVMTSVGAPRIFRSSSLPSGSMPVLVPNGQAESLGVASSVTKIASTTSKPVFLSGTLNGQRVFLQTNQPGLITAGAKKLNISMSQNVPVSVAPSSSAVSSGSPCTISFSNVSEKKDNSLGGAGVGHVQPLQVSTNCVHGQPTVPVNSPFYPPVKFVTSSSGTLSNTFVPITTPTLTRQTLKAATGPQSLSATGGPQMVPVRVVTSPTNTPGAIVKLIPVSSTSLVNSANSAIKSGPGSTGGFIAVPVHFGNPPLTSQSDTTLTQSENICDTTTAGVKTCTTNTQRSGSLASGSNDLTSVKNPEPCVIQISKSPINMCPVTGTDYPVDLGKNTSNIENPEKNKSQKNDSGLNAGDVQIISSDPQLKKVSTKKRRKSYATKLDDLNNLDKNVNDLTKSDRNVNDLTKSVRNVNDLTKSDRNGTDLAIRDNSRDRDCDSIASDDKLMENIDCIVDLHSDKQDESKNKPETVKLCENLSNDIIDLSKNVEDAAAISESVYGNVIQDGNAGPMLPTRNIDRDSIDGDINFDSSSGTSSESGDSSTVNIDLVIDNTKNAGLQIASVLGNTLDSPVIETADKKIESKGANSSKQITEIVDEVQSENVLSPCSVTINNDAQDTDICLIIDENYKSPDKCERDVQVIETQETVKISNKSPDKCERDVQVIETQETVNNKRKLEETGTAEPSKRLCRSEILSSKIQTEILRRKSEEREKVDGEAAQISIQDSKNKQDVEVVDMESLESGVGNSGLLQPQPQVVKVIRHISSQSTVTVLESEPVIIEKNKQDVEVVDLEPLESSEGSSGLLQPQVVKVIRHISSQSPVTVLDSEPVIIEKVHTASSGDPAAGSEQFYHRKRKRASEKRRRVEFKKIFSQVAKIVLMYNQDVKKKCIKFLSDSTVQLPKVLILDGAKSLIDSLHEEYQCLHELRNDGQQYHESLKQKLTHLTDSFVESGVPELVVHNFLKGVASSAKYMDSNSEDSGNQSATPSNLCGRISPVDLTEDDADGVIMTTLSALSRRKSRLIDSISVSSSSDCMVGEVESPAMISLLKPTVSTTSNVCIVENNSSDCQVLSDSINSDDPSLHNDLRGMRRVVMEKEQNVTDGCHGDKNSDKSVVSMTTDVARRPSSENCKDDVSNIPTIDLTDDKNTSDRNTHKTNNNQEIIDNQSSASKIQTSQSKDTSSQSSSQSDKIIVMDSTILENSAARINHSELLILDDSDTEEKGEVHHLDDILDEWSTEICSQ